MELRDDELMHYGKKFRSGRYPYGSGENPYQHAADFLGRINELKKGGMKEAEIAKALGMTTTQYRAQKAVAKNEERMLQVERARSLRDDGLSLNQIAKEMGFKNDSSVRSLLDENAEARMNQAMETAFLLKENVDTKGMIDIGTGIEKELGISKEKLDQAVEMMKMEGYVVYGGGVPQVTNKGQQTNIKVLCPPGTEHKEIYNFDQVHTINDYVSVNNGETFKKVAYPKSMDLDRVKIRYAEEGGIEKDGLVEIRRGVDDLSLGQANYAQVRILVDGDRYIKGMAVYSDNMPDGVDVVFNTNKKVGTAPRDVLKKIKDDPDNPFGALIKTDGGQTYYKDKNGKEQLGLINKTREEGDWNEWADTLSSQFLSKQPQPLIKRQLGLAQADKQSEFDDIMAINNPTIRKHYLKSYAEDCDAAAEHLKAAALPRQKYQVIIPIPGMKDNEIYAPNYENGEKVALVRYPHGGTFEIPILTVNNKHAESKKVLGAQPKDAVGINSKVAERLSGADFDGDTVMVIPHGGRINIKSTPLEEMPGLKGFDPKMSYGTTMKVNSNGDEEYFNSHGVKIKVMNNTQTEMGKVSNLITDMTIKGAPNEDIAKAVRHSMVVIDAEKHKLDYKQSEKDNDIAYLKKTYQYRVDEATGRPSTGAATVISRASGEKSVLKRSGQPWINEQTGELEWERYNPKTGKVESKYTGESYVDSKTGKVKMRTQQSTNMAETKDARTLVSDHNNPVEMAYADHANYMKAMANTARKTMLATGKVEYSARAKKTYQEEVNSLDHKLNEALKNAPRERRAQMIANSVVAAKKQDNPYMTKGEEKKASQQALNAAREQVGAKRVKFDITDREWEAIQAGAISEAKLFKILNNTDADKLRDRATPKSTVTLSAGKINRMSSMKNRGYSIAEIAAALGVSTSTVRKYM